MRFAFVLLMSLALSSQASAQSYRPYWSEDGAISFLRAANDSTVVSIDVRHTPHRNATEPSIIFSAYVLRCATRSTDSSAYALVGVGGNEAEALKERSPSTLQSVAFSVEEKTPAMVLSGCLQLRDRRTRGEQSQRQ